MPISGKKKYKKKKIKHSYCSKLRTAQMMILSLLAMIGLEKCCITSAYLQWLFHSGERAVAHGPCCFSYFSKKAYGVDTHMKCFNEVHDPMNRHNIILCS